jgi:hypothetical protein
MNQSGNVRPVAISQIRQESGRHAVAAIPADDVGLAETAHEAREYLRRDGGVDASPAAEFRRQMHEHENERPPGPTGARSLDGQEIAKCFLVVRLAVTILPGDVARTP